MKRVLFILLAVSCQLSAVSQQCESLLSKRYLKSYWDSGLTVLEQPLHYDWKDWTVFGGVAAATTLAFVYDDEIYNFINDNFYDKNVNSIAKFTNIIGKEIFILRCIAGTYVVSAINKDCRLRNMSLAVLQSFVYAEVVSAGLKVLTCRVRPSDVNGQQTTDNGQSWLGPFATFHQVTRCVLLQWLLRWQDSILKRHGLGLLHIQWRHYALWGAL